MQQSTENRPRNLATYPGKMPGIEYAYLKLLQCLQTLVIKKQRHMRVSSSGIDYSSKIKPPIPSHLTQLVRPSILRNNITFYVHIFKMQMPCIPYEGQTWCKVVNIMWILYALIYLLIILLFEIIYPSKCQNTIDFQQLMLPRDI